MVGVGRIYTGNNEYPDTEGISEATGKHAGPEIPAQSHEFEGEARKYPNKAYESLRVAVPLTGVTPGSPEHLQQKLEQELHDWWLGQAEREVAPLLDKMREYGGGGRALDLEEIGRGLVNSGVSIDERYRTGRGEPQEGHLQELGVYFYLLGKFARWTAAVAEGRPVSDDTLYDIGVYVRMVQRIRSRGGWPV